MWTLGKKLIKEVSKKINSKVQFLSSVNDFRIKFFILLNNENYDLYLT
jgi:hypothetical protein